MIHRTRLQQGLASALLAFAALSGAHAQSVLDTGTPSGGLIGGLSISSVNWMAESFTLASTTNIGSIMAYVNSTDDLDIGQGFTVALYASKGAAGAQVPDLSFFADNQNQLHQFTATYTGAGWTGQSGLNWSLGAGTYFVAIETDGNGVQGLVLPTGGLSQLPGAVAFYTGGNGYDHDPDAASDAFGLQVTAAAVPEPTSLALLMLGLGAGGLMLRRRHQD